MLRTVRTGDRAFAVENAELVSRVVPPRRITGTFGAAEHGGDITGLVDGRDA